MQTTSTTKCWVLRPSLACTRSIYCWVLRKRRSPKRQKHMPDSYSCRVSASAKPARQMEKSLLDQRDARQRLKTTTPVLVCTQGLPWTSNLSQNPTGSAGAALNARRGHPISPPRGQVKCPADVIRMPVHVLIPVGDDNFSYEAGWTWNPQAGGL